MHGHFPFTQLTWTKPVFILKLIDLHGN